MAVRQAAVHGHAVVLSVARGRRCPLSRFTGSGPARLVDFVVEAGDDLLPIEVKATERPRLRDVARLRSFRAEYCPAARPGILLHAGTDIEWIAPDVLAAPWWCVPQPSWLGIERCCEPTSQGVAHRHCRVLQIGISHPSATLATAVL